MRVPGAEYRPFGDHIRRKCLQNEPAQELLTMARTVFSLAHQVIERNL